MRCLLAPELEPPAGFEARTLARLGAPRRRSRRRLLITGRGRGGCRRHREHHRGPNRRVEHRPGRIGAGGGGHGRRLGALPAGWAYVTDGQGVAVAVDYGIPDGDYTVRADPAVGSASTSGTMTVTAGRGSFTGKPRHPLAAGIDHLVGGCIGKSDMSRNRRLRPLRFARHWKTPPVPGAGKARQDMRRLWIIMAAVLAFGGFALLAPSAGAASQPSARFCAAAAKIGKSNSSDLKKFAGLASAFKTAGKNAPPKVKAAANKIASVLGKVKGMLSNPTDLAKFYTTSDFKDYGKSVGTFFVYADQCST